MTDPDDLAKMGKLASSVLRLRAATSTALIAFAEIEKSEDLDQATACAKAARIALRRALGTLEEV